MVRTARTPTPCTRAQLRHVKGGYTNTIMLVVLYAQPTTTATGGTKCPLLVKPALLTSMHPFPALHTMTDSAPFVPNASKV